jgi:epsilon-lactone hydrolase
MQSDKEKLEYNNADAAEIHHLFDEDAKATYYGLVEQGSQKIAIVGNSARGGLALVLLAIAQSDALTGGAVAPSAAVAISP